MMPYTQVYLPGRGKWTTKMDLVWKQPGTLLGLDKQSVQGVCENECKSVQRACVVGLKGREDKSKAPLL